eukprot:CAMPEP_0171066766 /NCGR_PEP_ID=MMETSP0766_2-20121228/7608_1 /TAXON_ID=439317 /ORGANISM="Gambierdiscus australes, Strain CAWD 149" /LENGTH=73 /DNA_ID=CAMNT_0011522955 /DNA_START=48 /DNA_END=266 /DNA_ORIENTATION=-
MPSRTSTASEVAAPPPRLPSNRAGGLSPARSAGHGAQRWPLVWGFAAAGTAGAASGASTACSRGLQVSASGLR